MTARTTRGTAPVRQGRGNEILLQLLTSGVVTKEQIIAAKTALKEPA